MGPLDISGKFIWIGSPVGERTIYLYVEGTLRTNLHIDDVYAALDATLLPGEYRSGRTYRISSAKVFQRLMVRDDKRFALLTFPPIEIPDVPVLDRFGEMAEDLRRVDKLVSSALGGDEESVLDFELLSCQAMLPYG